MLTAAPALLLLGSAVSLHLETITRIGVREAYDLATELGRALELRTGHRVSVDDPAWSGTCATQDRCVTEARARTGADAVVLLRLHLGLTQLRLAADGFVFSEDGAPRSLPRVSADLPPDPPARGPSLTQLADHLARLLPASAGAGAQAAPIAAGRVEAEPWPWIALGAGVATGLTGAAFGLSSAGARRSIETELHSDDEIERLQSRLGAHARTANALFGVAVIATATGVVLWLLE